MVDELKTTFTKALMLFAIFTIGCGVLYTGLITGAAQTLFPEKANGSLIIVGGKKYGSELLGQQFTDNRHMWGRIMKLNVMPFKDTDGRRLLYSVPSNLSPASGLYKELTAGRVAKLRAAHPEKGDAPVPVDLVTNSGSGLDPHISPAAAEYQVARIAKARGMSEDQVRAVIKKCTTGRFLGFMGEETVNVLKVNLMLDGVLQ